MSQITADFPIFITNPDLIYLDSAATLMKPQIVIDWISSYLSTDYANIHRWKYNISQRSEEIYRQARKNVATFMWASDESEVIFTANSTDSTNLLVRSLIRSGSIHQDDEIIVSSLEHHANILCWQFLAKQTGARLIYINIWANWVLDPKICIDLITNKTKIIALTLCSNVTGVLRDHEIVQISTYLSASYEESSIQWSRPLLVLDASQYIVHDQLDVHKLWADFCFWTGHKLWALTGVWVLRWKKELLKQLPSWKVWWGAIEMVSRVEVISLWSPDKFEPWTPNIVGALSLDLAIKYVCGLGWWEIDACIHSQDIAWWYAVLNELEKHLIEYCLEQFDIYMKAWKLTLLWSQSKRRIWVFSFVLHGASIGKFSQSMQQAGVALRTGAHCAHIYHQELWETLDQCEEWCVIQTCRISLWWYTTMQDIEKFWEVMEVLCS